MCSSDLLKVHQRGEGGTGKDVLLWGRASHRYQRLRGGPTGKHLIDVRPERAEVRGESQVDVHLDVDLLKLRLVGRDEACGGGSLNWSILTRFPI